MQGLAFAAVSIALVAERIALAWSDAGRRRDGLVVAAYLGEVGRLELEGEFHQGVCNVRGGFVGDGVFGWPGSGLARHSGRSIYSSISSFMRKAAANSIRWF
jgi:hypothetical protein